MRRIFGVSSISAHNDWATLRRNKDEAADPM
jgi:hypothetical protein